MTSNFLPVTPDNVFITDKLDVSKTIEAASANAHISDTTAFEAALKVYSQLRHRMRGINPQVRECYIEVVEAASTLLYAADWVKCKAQFVYNEQHSAMGPEIDIVAAFYNAAVVLIQETQRTQSQKQRCTNIGMGLYYIEQALKYTKHFSINSNILCTPFLDFLQKFYTAQLYECSAALVWSTQEENRKTDFEADSFPSWSKLVAGAIEFYKSCAKVENSFTLVLKKGYIERFQISNEKVHALTILLYHQSAEFNAKSMLHAEAKADALYCQRLGGHINIMDYFEAPAEQETAYQSFKFNMPEKYKEWECIFDVAPPIDVIFSHQINVIEQIQGYMQSQIQAKKLEKDHSNDKHATEHLAILSELEVECRNSAETTASLRILLQKCDILQRFRYLSSEGARSALLEGSNACLRAKNVYETLLATDRENQQRCGSLWDSHRFYEKVQSYHQNLCSVVEIGKQIPVCVSQIEKLDVNALDRILERAAQMTLTIDDELPERIARIKSRLEYAEGSEDSVPDEFWIKKNAQLPLEKANAKTIAQQLIGGKEGNDNEPEATTADAISSEIAAINDEIRRTSAAFDLESAQLCKTAANLLNTLESVENYAIESKERANKHSVLCKRIFDDYKAQIEEKFHQVQEGNVLTIDVLDD